MSAHPGNGAAPLRLHLVNPNTSEAMTRGIAAAAQAVAGPDTRIEASTSAMGPASIETHYDEALCLPGLLEAVRRAEAAGVDGHVIACFGDPGLDAARELARGPVLGIAEAAMQVASLVGGGFSVVTTLERTLPTARALVERYGMTRRCRGLRAVGVAVLDLEQPGSDARARVEAECRRALSEDRCDALILGCAGMADFAADLTARLQVPVIDGVAAAVKLAEAVIGLGLGTSKTADYAPPLTKAYTGRLADFEVG